MHPCRPLPFALAVLCLGVSIAGCSAGHTTPQAPQAAHRSTRHALSVVELSSYNVNPNKVYVAGISSGGFFAPQMHFAHSSVFKGAAVYAGGVEYCAQDSEATAIDDCGGAGLYGSELAPSESYINANSGGSLDPDANISGQKVYLWSGTDDDTVPQKSMNDLQTEYQHYGATVTYDNDYPAGHGWESPYGTVACGTTESPYMISCNNLSGGGTYDSEKTWLTLFFGTLNAKNTGTLTGSLINFDQTAFGASASNSMDTNGYVFVPTSCAGGTSCGLVVAFHGCLQTQSDIGTDFVTESGIDQWADTNNIIVLYPYAVHSETNPSNPNGCWDWWGYDDANYANKNGTQIGIVFKMVQKLMGGSSATPTPTPVPTGSPTSTPAPTPTPHATPTPQPTPTAKPTPTPTPTPTSTPTSLGCWTTNNYAQTVAGRAYESYGYALADGSNQNMGLDNVYYMTSLNETSPGYYVIVSQCP
jgi:poly(3-hydroxybutyrate) depolymerase